MSFIFTPPATPSVAIEDNDARFPVRRIFCVGRNYADHAREMGKDPDREPPFFFTKPADAVCDSGSAVPYPPMTSNFHHEVELVVAIGSEARNVPVEDALSRIWGYGVGIDLTRRDLQLQARDLGRPWDWGKAFDMSAPCGPLRKADLGHLQGARIRLEINGSTRQKASLDELIWSVPEIVSLCSASVVLQPGDLIFTGTPAGVSAIEKGDRLVGSIDGLPDVVIEIA
ncbi:putative Fumarylacetoacetate hydrolase family protein [Agrobacterium deltaense Zutra 3/1]|uniref:Putative Fumarylacetoacetate hydrolase family protein n=1 Tax=Agrobacterium deltaense Zutra 3/1 TaxID=1183427 RepID=A0A1S7S2E7_9HYPH|nr:fumarylacetoacetate hydrolase family protein [Agrobacterium deltaense]CUX61489.1 putative Fumarylacetoacetate hydrolase family protein [Agrobacterium deltaense Zutra 3/1]